MGLLCPAFPHHRRRPGFGDNVTKKQPEAKSELVVFTGECEKCGHDKLLRVVVRQFKGIGYVISGKLDEDRMFECVKCHARQTAPRKGELWA